jgi:chromosomal replication initiator protein
MHPSRARLDSWTLPHLVPVPENRFALVAIQRVAGCLAVQPSAFPLNPLVLHGPPGTGKTHLVHALVDEACRKTPGLSVALLGAGDFKEVDFDRLRDRLAAEAEADLLVVEDLQHLPARAAETFIQLLDQRLAHGLPVIVTTAVSPRCLVLLPARLTSRLAGGLVVGLDAFSASSRLAILQAKAQRRQLAVRPEVLGWLADHLPGNGRQLGSALDRLDLLARFRPCPLELTAVVEHFREQAAASRPSIGRILQQVGSCFQVDPQHMLTTSRARRTLLPRQVTMYLARELTALSLEEIGAYFGGRDHSTVLHACRKVAAALSQDAALAATVRELRAACGFAGDSPVESPLLNGRFPVGDG